MNPVEIEQAIENLAHAPFDRDEFAFAFLESFGNKETTIKRLRSGSTNQSDVKNGVLQRNNIHIAVTDSDETATNAQENSLEALFQALKTSPKTAANKVKFIFATDGKIFLAEDLISGEVASGNLCDLTDHFGFFLSLAGISTIKEIKHNPIDIKATARLNRLYIELLKENPDWGEDARRHDLNQFIARLIFCFFAEDTGIFQNALFTKTIDQMTDKANENADEIIANCFRAMDIKIDDRKSANLPNYANNFPYVNGSLFSGSNDVPHFSRIARSYLIRAGELDWQEINPDIFGSMIQGVADADERANLGMHYTSVPNILKVLNPLFLDDLRQKLTDAGDNRRKLLALRRRLAKIRVFDPACGSGNFLVIAYIELRQIEFEICNRLNMNDEERKSALNLKNFYGLEIKDFAVEIARLSLLIAEYQCDVRFISQIRANQLMLPLRDTGTIKCCNALRQDWLAFCPPTSALPLMVEDAPQLPYDGAEKTEPAMDEDNAGGETYICGNPPYVGSTWQSAEQKDDLKAIFDKRAKNWKSLDYVAGWFLKAADYAQHCETASAFVSTNSICQGQQVPILWPLIYQAGRQIAFAYTSFKWANLASHNAGVTVIIVGLAAKGQRQAMLYEDNNDGVPIARMVDNINAYLVAANDVIIDKQSKSISDLSNMDFGNKPVDGGNLFLSESERQNFPVEGQKFIRSFLGSDELINGLQRYCLWIEGKDIAEASAIPEITKRLDAVQKMRAASSKAATQAMAKEPYKFAEARHVYCPITIIVPSVSSENREYLPIDILADKSIVGNSAFALYDAPLWNMALIASRLHLVWIATVCGKLETRYRYSNTLGWNTFPVPVLTANQKQDLTLAAQNILLTRERHFPKTIADLYKQDAMPDDLRAAHAYNDEILERIYIGRKFKNDTERLEKLFELYTKMTQKPQKGVKTTKTTKTAKAKGGNGDEH